MRRALTPQSDEASGEGFFSSGVADSAQRLGPLCETKMRAKRDRKISRKTCTRHCGTINQRKHKGQASGKNALPPVRTEMRIYPRKSTNQATRKLDDGWPESVEEQGLLLLVWRHHITKQYIKDVLYAVEKRSIKTI